MDGAADFAGAGIARIMRAYRTERKGLRMPVINTIELEGLSDTSWGDAAREALKEAAKTIRGINKLEVVSTATTIKDGRIAEYRTQVRLYFVVEDR
jgi:flavin-binding protein dodecin